ncbi:UBC-like protein [Nadsonia fulvescens var. elongata DSM 6958]|uniref:UBC-like protein n=1 Tax=Nadsonia fulvescens var. elongata DSM 6958 TaxID=857566 RepID=A0A1E3PJP6_9ASCO|nr:UBC-like protein [Nadsonia fulvescens var. elongata DSM 6958]
MAPLIITVDMTLKRATARLTKEYAKSQRIPPPLIFAIPDESNSLIWHYALTGSPDTPYESAQYYVTLSFKSNYPYCPPAIRIITSNGRFAVNTRICISVFGFHPGLWQPAWTVDYYSSGLTVFHGR